MTFGGLRTRQIIVLVLVVVGIVGISMAVEISEVTRTAVRESRRDADYVANSLVRQIQAVVAEHPRTPAYEAVGTDPRIRVALDSATRFAPTVLYVAFCDSTCTVVAHNNPDRVGTVLPRPPVLPEASGFRSAWSFLLELRGESGRLYEVVTPLRTGGSSFGSVRVGLSSAFIQAEVDHVIRRGVTVGLGQVLLALVAAFFATRIFVRPLRAMRRGIEALREGDFSYCIPRQGIDEFASMADAINELGDRFRARNETGEGDPLRHAMEHLADGLLLVGPEREILHVNGIAARHLGFDKQSLRGRNLNRALPQGHPLRRLTDAILAGKGDRMSLRAELPRTGNQAEVLAVGHRIDDGSGASRVLIEFKDLTMLSDLQAVMDHSTTLSRLGEMAAGVAHEIRNPLNAITLHLEPLRAAEDLDPAAVREAVEVTRTQIGRLDRAVSGFLKVARLQRLTLAPLRPAALAKEVVELLTPEATMAGLELVLEADEDLPEVMGDAEVLRQALLNLVKNAVQALPSREGRVELSCRRTGERVRLAVRDTGPGISAKDLPRIFDLYMTTKTGGTGVGLAFVRQAVEMHRGTVNVESEPEMGTTISLWLRARAATEVSRA